MQAGALHPHGQCQRLGCGKQSNATIRIDGEFFVADLERGVEAGFRLYGLKCCGMGLLGTVEGLRAILARGISPEPSAPE